MAGAVALFGTGWAGAMHARAARAAGLEIATVAGRDPARTAAFAERFAIPRWTTDWPAVAADPAAGLAVIATPNALHAPQALACLAAGKHVLVEKPMALSTAEAEAMIAAAAAAGRVLGVGHVWRYRDEVIALRDRIAAGGLGRIVRTHGHGVHAGWGPSGWFTDPALAGGGALIDMGIHAIDTARFLLGDPRAARVQASLGRGAFGAYPVDDDGLVLIDWEGGARSLVEFGWNQPRLNGLEAETEVLGTAGAARIWPDMPPIPPDYEHCSLPMFAAQLADVAACCVGGGTPRASAAAGLEALAIAERAYAAAREGQP